MGFPEPSVKKKNGLPTVFKAKRPSSQTSQTIRRPNIQNANLTKARNTEFQRLRQLAAEQVRKLFATGLSDLTPREKQSTYSIQAAIRTKKLIDWPTRTKKIDEKVLLDILNKLNKEGLIKLPPKSKRGGPRDMKKTKEG